MQELTAQQLAEELENATLELLDVREAWEVALAGIQSARHIPLGELPHRLSELDRTRPHAVLCHHGVRSAMATQYLTQQGFKACNVTGGIDAWSQTVDPSTPRY